MGGFRRLRPLLVVLEATDPTGASDNLAYATDSIENPTYATDATDNPANTTDATDDPAYATNATNNPAYATDAISIVFLHDDSRLVTTGVVGRSKEVSRTIGALGYSHFGKGVKEDHMPKLAAAVLAAIEELIGNEGQDNRDTLAAWKKYLDFVTVQFNAGLRRAAAAASEHVSASLRGEEKWEKLGKKISRSQSKIR